MPFTMPNEIRNGASRDARPVQANFAAIQTALNNDYPRTDGTIAMAAPLTLSGDPSSALHAATKGYVDTSVPVGVIWDYSGAVAPDGWGLCQGQLVSKALYPLLWDLIGETYGADTDTQFRLPDLRNRITAGKGTDEWADTLGETGGSKDLIVPSHTHSLTNHVHSAGAHTHGVTGTAAAGGNHNHGQTPGVVTLFWSAPGGGVASAGTGATVGVHAAWEASGTHTHTVSGTAAAGSGNTGNPTSLPDVGTTGEAATDKNLPPYIVLNKIIRLG